MWHLHSTREKKPLNRTAKQQLQHSFSLLAYRGNYSATSNNVKFVHGPLTGRLLHLVQLGGAWAGYDDDNVVDVVLNTQQNDGATRTHIHTLTNPTQSTVITVLKLPLRLTSSSWSVLLSTTMTSSEIHSKMTMQIHSNGRACHKTSSKQTLTYHCRGALPLTQLGVDRTRLGLVKYS